VVPQRRAAVGGMTYLLVALLCAAAASAILTGVVRAYAVRSALLDVPNERSLHRAPTPRGGGVAIVLVTIAALAGLAALRVIPASVAWTLGGGGALVAVVGWLDDRRGVRAPVRAAVHTLAAAWAVAWIWGEPTIGAGLGALAIVWAINLYNFMDGIDGLAAGEAVSVGAIGGALLLAAGGATLAMVALLVAAAAAGFLAWNWEPARIFMGDVGSGFLGYAFGTLALLSHRSGAVPITLWLLVLGVFLFDATVTLLRRMARGERWYQAHRSHAYQRLVQAGLSHAWVARLTLLVNLVLGALAWVAQSRYISVAAAVLAGTVVLAVLYLAIERRRPMYAAAPDPRSPDQDSSPR
jgi:Fuc2NAc and GlcNAc transferase